MSVDMARVDITGRLRLPADVVFTAAHDLSEEMRERTGCGPDDVAVTRPRARTPTKIIGADAAALLEHFRDPTRVVDAVIQFSRGRSEDPMRVLEDAHPLVQDLLEAGFVVDAEAADAEQIVPHAKPGDRIGPFKVESCVHLVEDTEVYRCRDEAGNLVAVKVLRPGAPSGILDALERETAVLKILDGTVTPAVAGAGSVDGKPYLATEWCSGTDASNIADGIRRLPPAERRRRLARLLAAIAETYARLHDQGVIHGDVHPRNIVVSSDDRVRIVDLGFARVDGADSALSRARRGGIAYFQEPEYARARLGGHRPPRSTFSGEQFGLAALMYLLVTGSHYIEFSPEKDELRKQALEHDPLPFAAVGSSPWPDLEAVLNRALSKAPEARFPSTAAFARELRAIERATESSARPEPARLPPPSTMAAPVDALLAALDPAGELFATNRPAPTASVNFGSAGAALALLRIAAIRDDPRILAWADAWAAKASEESGRPDAFYDESLDIKPETVGHASPYHSKTGVHLTQALVSHATGDLVSFGESVAAFLDAARGETAGLDLTVGQSGLLVACAMLLPVARALDPASEPEIRQFGTTTAAEVWARADQRPRMRYDTDGYHGVAHGWAGVLYALLLWARTAGERPPPIEERLAELADRAEPWGEGVRWTRRTVHRREGRPDNYMPGWCNGSAGMVLLWTAAASAVGEPAYLDLAEAAGRDTAQEPSYGVDLCCGRAGQAYALLALHRATGDAAWLSRAYSVAGTMAPEIADGPGMGVGLYKSEVGAAVLLADMARHEEAAMPLFEAERWPAFAGAPWVDDERSAGR